jgi:hypothetical protein
MTSKTTNNPLSLVLNCIFSGPPPEPFPHWNAYFEHVQRSGVLHGLRISAISNGLDIHVEQLD